MNESMNKWMLDMRDYRFKIEYKMGKKNVVADQLSRPVRMIQGENETKLLGRSKEHLGWRFQRKGSESECAPL